MSLSRERAEELGLAFAQEDVRAPSSPNTPLYEANLTIDGHTQRIQGRSEEQVLEEAERLLVQRRGAGILGGGENE